ncbi:MAG: amylo-alpha-1,6-glucosidase [Armatimonadetes bacterium]|nr:amylo-alpha-1,6-glucosidase [Armatimonadota bacterium]
MTRYSLDTAQCRNYDLSSGREWLLTNGLGGFAMGTASGANTRRYHGILVAAIKPPAYRMVLLANLEVDIQSEGQPIGLSTNQYVGAVHPEGFHYLEEFSVGSFAEWNYQTSGMSLRKRIVLHPGVNATTVQFTNTGTKPFRLAVRPLVCHKFYHGNFRAQDGYPELVHYPKDKTIIEHEDVSLYMNHPGWQRQSAVGWFYRFEYPREIERGLDPRDDLYCPCELVYNLAPGESSEFVASSDPDVRAFSDWNETPAGKSFAQDLREAASKFFIQTEARTSIIAGYPWFTDWGRDTMIALPGLCLHTGRIAEARQIISDYAGQMKNGLIPNRFVEEGEEAEYNTVDATLWFANAIYQTLQAEWDEPFAKKCMKSLDQMFKAHMKGTLYNIHVDPADGLLSQGKDGVQLTWMDAKLGDWVVTPRHGKPIEINGLWINALRVMEWLADKLSVNGKAYREAAERAELSFDLKFWRESLGYYVDTVDPDDASLRPNQVIAMSLPFGPAQGEKAGRALDEIARSLLTPVGLRTLSPDSVHYRGRFRGPMAELDSAYHQGTVWPWLIGPYATAIVKIKGDKAEAKRILKQGKELLSDFGLGGIAEVFDGDEPRKAAGCPWQAWSVAEWLRAWVEDAGGN